MSSGDPESGTNAVEITARHLLLVEGRDEKLFFTALMGAPSGASLPECQVIALGRQGFRRQLKALAVSIRGGWVESLGVVRDADDHSAGALQSVCDSLVATGFPSPISHGAIVGTNPRVGVFVMPDGTNPGALEALCRRSVETEPPGSCVEEYLHCLDERGGWGRAERSTTLHDKAFVHAFLASRKDPVARTGEGAQQGVWDFQHEAFRALRDFLLRLTTG